MELKEKVTIENRTQTSKLFNMEPVGVNSPCIESLTSYVSRLAEAHCVDSGTLIGKVITPILNKHYLNNVAKRGGSGLYGSASGLNGLDVGALHLVQTLQKLTSRKDLIHTTMLTWSNVFPTRGLIRSRKAWCPVCYQEWKNSGKPVYDPLIWFIQQVEICPIHHIHLIKKCSYCLQEIPVLSRRTRPGFCSKCGQWLGQSIEKDTLLDQKKHKWDFWKTKNIGELLESTLSMDRIPERSRVKKALKKAVKECTDGEQTTFAKHTNIPKSTFISWYKENRLPPLASLLKISHYSGVSLKQFLLEPLSQITFRAQALPEYFDAHGKVEKKKSYPKKSIHQQLTYWANSDREPPPSVKEIAAQIGCDRKLLYYKAPELCKVISQKYYDYIENRSKKRLERVKKQVKNAITTLNENGIYPSARKVEEFLKMPGVIREQAIQLYWNQELEKLDHGQLK